MKQSNAEGILFVSPVRQDQSALRRLAGTHSPTPVASCRQAFRRLDRDRFAVVFCDGDLPDGSWLDIVDHITTLSDPPLLIVTSRLADDYLWSKVLNLGGFDVLATPFQEREVRHVLETALAHRHGPARCRYLRAGA